VKGRWVKPEVDPTTQSGEHGAFMAEPTPGAPTQAVQDDAAAARTPLTLTVDQRHASVLRGHELRVQGRVLDAGGRGVSGLRIEVSLASDERKERMLLGVSVTGEQGVFAGDFGIPPDLAVGEYRMVVITPGDDHHLPAIAE
jgi:protocatechuate 3,4-dioxygenase beta subunit